MRTAILLHGSSNLAPGNHEFSSNPAQTQLPVIV